MTTVDQNKADAFAGQMLAALNNSANVLMLSVGHRTGLSPESRVRWHVSEWPGLAGPFPFPTVLL